MKAMLSDRPLHPLAALDRAIVAATQSGLPLTPEPYETVANQLAQTNPLWANVTGEQVQARLSAMLADGRVRRIGVVPNHYALGYVANGMSVWDVADAYVDTLGERVGALPFVTHCYRRPRALPDWPYNLFAMVHAADQEAVHEHVREIEMLLGKHVRAKTVLFSRQILKKTGLRLE